MCKIDEIKEVEIKSAFLSVRNGIVWLRIKPNFDIDVEFAKEGLDKRIELQNGKPALCVVDSRDMLNMTAEARKFIAEYEKEHNLNIALAILSESLATNIIANFFIKFNKPYAPTKLFKDEESALAWLETYR